MNRSASPRSSGAWSSLKTRIRPYLDVAFTSAWCVGHWIRGRALRPVRRWQSPGGQRVLVVAPHPDDEIAGCGGTIVKHLRAGDRVSVLVVTDGRRSRAFGLGPEAMARRRRDEATAALGALGVARWEWLGLPEGEWADDDLLAALEPRLARERPDVIYLPSRVDFHPEHRHVATVAARVLGRTDAGRRVVVRVYQLHVPLTRSLINVVSPTSWVEPEVVRAMASYSSQRGSLERLRRQWAYAGRSHGVPGTAEEFWEMGGAQYAAVHASEVARPEESTFRGLRATAMTDPLAYLRGRRERRRLRRVAHERSDARDPSDS